VGQPPGSAAAALEGVASLMNTYRRPWWIAGGWAIDLFVDRITRAHDDVDVAVLRKDQQVLQRHLADWRLTKVVAGTHEPWAEGQQLHLPVHQVHARRGEEEVEFFFNDVTADTWRFRRNEAVCLPLADLTAPTQRGLPALCPEVVLLFKAKAPRDKDHEDFQLVLPKLRSEAKNWLAAALAACHPGHPWRAQLLPP
jgi:Aminoglycoside-2''-adenylyltransferase